MVYFLLKILYNYNPGDEVGRDMRIKIDMNGNSPAYIQMSAQIAAAIRAGEYRTGDKLPSEAEFCHETGLAKGTVRKTFDKLEEEGYIRRVHGSGTYVQGSRNCAGWCSLIIAAKKKE